MSRVMVVHSAAAPPLASHLSPARIWGLWRRHRDLIVQFARREVLERHHGAALGLLWNVINPALSLLVFTFIFGVVMGVTWPEHVNHNGVPFAIILFCGQTIFHIFAESANRAPTLVIGRRSFVRKVVFPLEILSMSAVGSTLVYLAIGVAITLVAAAIATGGGVSSTVWMFPLVCVPLYALCLGVSWFLSSISVFIPDVRQMVGVLVTLLMFASGVFYPVERIPEHLRWLVEYNPIYVLIESSRRTLLWSMEPEWLKLGIVAVGSLVVMQLGYAFFAKSKRGMADVV